MPAMTMRASTGTAATSPIRAERLAEQWYAQYHARLRSFCLKQIRDPGTADDIAQETLLRAWTRRERFADGVDLAPWLFRVARNLCTDALRARARFTDDAELPDAPALDADPLLPIERAEMGELVRRALSGLSDRDRRALMLRDVEGVDYREVAEHLGVTEPCARVVLLRARRGLRKRVLEFTSAMAALVGIALRRSRSRFDPALAQPVGLVLGQAGLTLVAAATFLLAPVPGAAVAGITADVDASINRDAPGATVIVTPTYDGVEPPVVTRLTDRRSLPTRASVHADRSGQVRARGTTPNPTTGGDAEVWVGIERQADESNSTVLDAVDETNASTCATTAPACDAFEGVTR